MRTSIWAVCGLTCSKSRASRADNHWTCACAPVTDTTTFSSPRSWKSICATTPRHCTHNQKGGAMNLSQNVASEDRSRAAGAQEPECTYEYMRIPSTAGARDVE